MPREKVEKTTLTEEEVEKLVKIPRYSTIRDDYYFDDLYCDPEKRVFYKRTKGDEFRVRRSEKWNQTIFVVDNSGKKVHIPFSTLIRQYPELRSMYDFNFKRPIRVRVEDGNIEISMDSSLESSIINSFMDEEEF